MELADEGIRAGFALGVLLVGGLIRWYGTRLIRKVDGIVEAVEHTIPHRLDKGDARMGRIEDSVSGVRKDLRDHMKGRAAE